MAPSLRTGFYLGVPQNVELLGLHIKWEGLGLIMLFCRLADWEAAYCWVLYHVHQFTGYKRF